MALINTQSGGFPIRKRVLNRVCHVRWAGFGAIKLPTTNARFGTVVVILSPRCFIQVQLEVVASITLGLGGTKTPPSALFMTLLALLILIGVKHVQAGQSAGTILFDIFTFFAVNITSQVTPITHLITVEASLQNKSQVVINL